MRRASSARHRLQKTRCCLKSGKRDIFGQCHTELALNSVSTNPIFWIQSPKPILFCNHFYSFFPLQDSEQMVQTIPCVRDAPLRWWRVDSLCADVGNVFSRFKAYSLFAHWMVQQCSISKTRHCADGVKTLCERTWRMNCFSFAHTLFCVCPNSSMSRSFLTSTLSWAILRQPVGEKCCYFSTEKFQSPQ